jgi:hypothetical protein
MFHISRKTVLGLLHNPIRFNEALFLFSEGIRNEERLDCVGARSGIEPFPQNQALYEALFSNSPIAMIIMFWQKVSC